MQVRHSVAQLSCQGRQDVLEVGRWRLKELMKGNAGMVHHEVGAVAHKLGAPQTDKIGVTDGLSDHLVVLRDVPKHACVQFSHQNGPADTELSENPRECGV